MKKLPITRNRFCSSTTKDYYAAISSDKNSEFQFLNVSEKSVKKWSCLNTNKATGMDQVLGKILYGAADVFGCVPLAKTIKLKILRICGWYFLGGWIWYILKIFPIHYQKVAHTCMLMMRLFSMKTDIHKVKDVLTKEFSTLCEWFLENKLPNHFGENKTKVHSFF